MNVITIKINGVDYNLKGEEQEEYLNKVASYVDKKMQSIVDKNSKLSSSSAAILTAINSVDELFKKIDRISELESYNNQLKNILESKDKEIQRLKVLLQNQEKKHEEILHQLQNKKDVKQVKTNTEEIKELRFKINSSRYKILDLEKKLSETQIKLAKEKNKNNPLINTK